MQCNAMQCNAMQCNAMQWNGMEWNGMEWNGMEWNGMEWNGMYIVTTQYMMLLANLFSRICSARGQFVIVVANQCACSGNMLRCWENPQTFRPLVSFLLRRITSLALNIEGKNINRCLGGF